MLRPWSASFKTKKKKNTAMAEKTDCVSCLEDLGTGSLAINFNFNYVEYP